MVGCDISNIWDVQSAVHRGCCVSVERTLTDCEYAAVLEAAVAVNRAAQLPV